MSHTETAMCVPEKKEPHGEIHGEKMSHVEESELGEESYIRI